MSLWKNKEWLIEQYINQKKSMKTIASLSGVGETCIHKWLHRFSIPIRSRSNAMKGLKKSDEHKVKLANWAKQRTGNKNPNWKGGVTKIGLLIRGRGYRQRRKLVLERDNYECQECGIDMDLHIHHIKLVKDNPELVNELSNCVTLCGKCHRKLHFPKENLANSVKPQLFEVGNAEPSTTTARWNPDWMSTPTGAGACVETIYEKSLKRDYDIVRL